MNLTRVPSLAAVLLVCGPLLAQVPSLEVDASWPQPLPSKWSIGPISSVAVGPNDHVWILQRPAAIKPDEKNGTTPAPPVIEYDTQGKVVQAWGGPGAGYDWPLNEHGIFVDYKGNVWIAGVGGKDWGRILKFTSTGKFLLQIGRPLPAGETFTNNNSTVLGRQPADVDVDPKTNELYVADGDGGAQRVMVFDAETGAFKRLWGAYGEKPEDGPAAKHDPNGPPSKFFSAAVHCVRIAKDGLVYACDRNGDRIQAFHQNGKFVKEEIIAPKTMGLGSAYDLDFTPDQKYFYVADGTNHKVWILQRDSLEIVGSIGREGSNSGEFQNIHTLAVDSKGNLITAEITNKRLQKFVPKTSR